MVGYGGQDSVRRLAKRLLNEQVKYPEPNVEGIEVSTSSIRDLLKAGHIAECLFRGLTDCPEHREETFGYGNEHIDRKFDSLSRAVLRLADTGHCDRDVLREGEETLQRLIQGVLEEEWELKRQVAPVEAAKWALFEEEVSNALGKKPKGADPHSKPPLFLVDDKDIMDAVSPNQIDAAQTDALTIYQICLYNRQALGVVLDGLKEINRRIDRDRPLRGGTGPGG